MFFPILSGGQRAFSPKSIAGLALWLDASDASTVTLDGSNNVSQWNDKSGNNRHATQLTALNRPQYVTNTYNGRSALKGDGVNPWMSFNGPDLSSANGYTIIAVGGIGSSTASGIYSQYPSSGTGNGIAIWSGLYRTGRSGTSIAFPTGNSTIQGVPFGFIYRNDGTKPTANTKVLATWNASERVSTTTQNAGTPAAGTAYLAAVNPADSPLQDKLCEVIIYDRQITDVERDALYNYLTAKWMPVYEAPPVASPALWLDASDTRTIDLETSNNVITWLDKSGNARHASQSTTLNRPSGLATINSLGAIGFDGINDCLQVPTISLAPSITVFAVYNQTNAASKLFFMEHSANAAANDGFFVYGSSPTTTVRRAGSSNSSTPSPQSSTEGTAARQATILWDTTLDANGQISRYWRDGSSVSMVASGINSGVTVANTTAATTLNIGSRNNGASVQYEGSLGELIIYDSPLSTTDRQLVEAYLKAKWGTP